MPSILNTHPPDVVADVAALTATLDAATPARMLDRNLLIAGAALARRLEVEVRIPFDAPAFIETP